ncbi:hypothetical protein M0R72_15970 [Candidatus Pacearchaeota archaeon]|jgi:hypothetical protein|nr:hypothetical protein [Candidatus Pacearchaeota archaeon]
MGTSSKWVKHTGGETLVFHEEHNGARWYDAIGANARKWEMRYGSDFTDNIEYALTLVGTTPTVAQGVTAGVRSALSTVGTNAGDGINMQLVGTPFQFAAGYPAYFGISWAFDNVLADWFVGLASLDDTIIDSSHALAIAASAIGFYGLGTSAVTAYSEIHASGSEGTTCAGTSSSVAHVYEFVYDGVSSVAFYMDGVLEATHTTYVPTVVLSPTIVLQNGSAAARTGTINWMRCIQLA